MDLGTNLKFNYDLLEASRKDFETIKCRVVSWQYEPSADKPVVLSPEEDAKIADYQHQFWDAMSKDLNTSMALSVFRRLVKDNSLPSTKKMRLLCEFDVVLGLGVESFLRHELTPEQNALLQARMAARAVKDFVTSDKIRDEFLQQGIMLEDSRDGAVQWYLKRQPKSASPVLDDVKKKVDVATLPSRTSIFSSSSEEELNRPKRFDSCFTVS